MTKHVIDHPATGDTAAMSEHFSKIEADRMPRPQTRELQKRTRKTSEGKRLKQYTDIERRSD